MDDRLSAITASSRTDRALTPRRWRASSRPSSHPSPRGRPPPKRSSALKANFRGYALGLGVSDYRGRKLITHTGGLPGYTSRLAWLPELNLGVAVLTNQESAEAWNAIAWTVLIITLGSAIRIGSMPTAR